MKMSRIETMRQLDQLEGQNAHLVERIEDKQKNIDEIVLARDQALEKVEVLQTEKTEVEKEFVAYKSGKEVEFKSLKSEIEFKESAEEKLKEGFENLANKIFEDKQKKFKESNKEGVDEWLVPLKGQLDSFRKRVDEVYDKENEQRTTLRNEITALVSLNKRISTDAINLTNALKGESKVRGNWGEVQLERLLEDSGLKKGREYETQVSYKNEDGKRSLPDVVVHLPEKKDVIIDSKVSLVAYEGYHSSDDETDREIHIKAHINSLKNHINELSAKSYDELIGVNSLELVLMFVPLESALMLALEKDPNLYTEAFEKKIVLVSPATLMGFLGIINNLWRYEYQNRNSLEIAAEAGKLHDQVVMFIEPFEKVGNDIRKAGESFGLAKKRLINGRGNVIGRTKKLKELGAKAKKKLSTELLELADSEMSESVEDQSPKDESLEPKLIVEK